MQQTVPKLLAGVAIKTEKKEKRKQCINMNSNEKFVYSCEYILLFLCRRTINAAESINNFN